MAIKKLLIIGFVWPEPNSSAAGIRVLQLIQVFVSQKYDITFASACTKTDRAFDFDAMGVKQVSIALNNSSFDGFVKELNPDIVLFDRFMTEEQFGWRVAEQCPNALRILDTEDLHCLRKAREQAFKDAKPCNNDYLCNDVAKREIASIYRSDLSLIISEAEMQLLATIFKVEASLLLYVPFMLENMTEDIFKAFPTYKERQHFVTIGNFLHEPNYNAVLYLKETIWPIIKQKIPQAELHIYGAYASQKVHQFHNENQGFFIKGYADDVNAVMQQAKVCLAPIRFGAGLKGKLVDAMQNGTPCVTTTIGAEGMFGGLQLNGFIEDDPESFADKAVLIYNDEALWNTKQQNGFQIINQRFNKRKFEQILILKIDELSQQLSNHRLANFTGQILQHHTLQSTKFMSKWIEEKHKS